MNLRKRGDNDDGNQIIFSKDHFYVKESDEKGRCVFAAIPFKKGEFLLLYSGKLIFSEPDCDSDTYIFEASFRGKPFWIDASEEDGSFGRLINDDHLHPNCRPKVIEKNSKPAIVFTAIRDISKDEEITYNYGRGKYSWRQIAMKAGNNGRKGAADSTSSIGLLISGMRELNHKVEISNFIKMNTPNAKVYTEFCNEVTHVILIPDENGVNRSLKYFQGIAHRCWVLNFSWITSSNSVGKILSESEYFISEDNAVGDVLGPRKAKSMHPPFLQGKKIFLHGFSVQRGDLGISIDDITDLIVSCGGIISNSLQEVSLVLSSNVDVNDVSPDDVKSFMIFHETYNLPTVCLSWFFDSVSEYTEEPIRPYILHKENEEQGRHVHVPSNENSIGATNVLEEDEPRQVGLGSEDHFDIDINSSRKPKLLGSVTSVSATEGKDGFDSKRDNTLQRISKKQEELKRMEKRIIISLERCDPSLRESTKPDRDSNGSQRSQRSQTVRVTLRNNFSLPEDQDDVEEEMYESSDDNWEPPDSSEGDSESNTENEVEDLIQSNSETKDIIDSSTQPSSQSDKMSLVYPSCSSNIVVQKANITKKGKRSGKLHCCLYCEKYYSRISRHYQQVHKSEGNVAKILALPIHSKERKELWSSLVNRGNYEHNFEVLKKGQGFLIPKYRPRKEEEKSYKKYAPCEYCLGSYVVGDLWKHQKNCHLKPAEDDKVKKRNVIHKSKMLWPVVGENQGFFENVFTKMREDNIKAVVGSDLLILQFADRLYDKSGSKDHQFQYIAQKTRELGRLLVQIRQNYPEIDCLRKVISPCNWKKLIESVKRVAGFIPNEHRYEIPSLPLKLGQSLCKCAAIVRSDGIQSRTNPSEKSVAEAEADGWLKLYADEWEDKVSTFAHSTLRDAKYNKPMYVPLAEDVACLNKYLQLRADELKLLLCKEPDKKECYYVELSEVCLSQLILFNRKRSGEAQRITLENYQTGTRNDSNPDKEVGNCLSKFELELCKTHKRIEIKGKRGRKVPVLLSSAIQSNISALLEARNRLEEPIKSKYLFAKPGSVLPLRGSDCLRKFAKKCNAKMPHLLTSTQLRKHLATMSQVLGLSEGSQDLLAKFMGHDIRVHREFYRLPENTLELAKVAKVLHLINSGGIAKFKDKDFDAIEFDIEAEIEVDQELNDDDDDDDSEDDEGCDDVDDHEDDNGDGDLYDFNDNVDDDDDDDDEYKTSQSTWSSRKRKACKTRHVWTSKEKEAIERQLGGFIREGKTPGQVPCLNAMKKEPILANHDWVKIKHTTRNIIVSKARKMMKY